MGGCQYAGVQIISRRPLVEFWTRYPDAKGPLTAWYHEVEAATWLTPNDIKATYATASLVGNNRVVFNIGGNKYRLIVFVLYPSHKVLIKVIGTHRQYDAIDATKVEL